MTQKETKDNVDHPQGMKYVVGPRGFDKQGEAFLACDSDIAH